MITIEIIDGCPMGLVAAVAAEHLGLAYELVVHEDGHFLRRYGEPGPRVVDGATARLGADAVGGLIARCLESSGASEAARLVAQHVATRVGPAVRDSARAHPDARPQAWARLRSALGTLDALVAVVPRADWQAGVLVPILAPLVRPLGDPNVRAELPGLVRRVDELVTSLAFERARARISAAAQAGVATPEDVLEFWFGAPVDTEDDARARARRWFRGGEEMDSQVKARFLPTVEAALRGDLDGWEATPRGRLALVIVLDQLTRNAFRGEARAWSGDPRARALCEEALRLGADAELTWIERLFLEMPLLHAEDRVVVARAIERARRGAATAPPAFAWAAEAHLEQATKYEAILARFGRYPFRNAALGRASTDEELAFLADFAAIAPPRAMRGAP